MLLALLLLTLHTPQQDSAIQAEIKTLQRQWRQEWRESDSLRIASILKRMRADSLQRVAKEQMRGGSAAIANATQQHRSALNSEDSSAAMMVNGTPDNEILATLQLQVAARTAAQRFDSLPTKPGQTLSDTITLEVLKLEADTGVASFYADEFHGKKTSSGSVYNMNDLTCAHRWLPFGTKLLVTNLANGRQVEVVVTDRGPFKQERLLDLSKGAAIELDMVRSGTARVAIRISGADR